MIKKGMLITGSTQGIGKATAIQALHDGWFVYLNYAHNDEKARECKTELDEMGFDGSYKIIKADVSESIQIDYLISQIDFENYPISGLVLNASSNGRVRHSFREIVPEEMNEMFQINLFAPFFLVQKLADYISEEGAIVFVSSHVGIYPHSTYIPYGLTKAAEIFLSRMLVKEFTDRKITVNVIAPAFIETSMFPGNRSEKHLESIKEKIAVNRFGHTDEVASSIMSIIKNHYINGSVLSIDGGYCFQ